MGPLYHLSSDNDSVFHECSPYTQIASGPRDYDSNEHWDAKSNIGQVGYRLSISSRKRNTFRNYDQNDKI